MISVLPALAQTGAGGPQDGSPVVHYTAETGRVDLHAVSVPLRSVLDALTDETGVVFYLPRQMNPPVNVSLEEVPLERAIKQLLGPGYNAAMIYVEPEDTEDPDMYSLAEVRVLALGGTSQAASAATPASSRIAGAVAGAPPSIPVLSPEEIAARRAEKEAKRADRDKAKAERQQAPKGRRGGGGAEPPAITPGSTPSPTAGAPPQTPGAPAPGSGAQNSNQRRR